MAKDESSSTTPLSDLLAQQVDREQQAGALADWAATMRDYYTALVAEGFDGGQALELTMAFQADTLSQAHDET